MSAANSNPAAVDLNSSSFATDWATATVTDKRRARLAATPFAGHDQSEEKSMSSRSLANAQAVSRRPLKRYAQYGQRPDSRSRRYCGMVRQWWSTVSKEWIGDVPDEFAYCQFECERPKCTNAIWVSCELRLGYLRMLRAHAADATSSTESSAAKSGSCRV
jgi:hypothetical protein